MANISPGVYSKIFDLSNYISAVPSTIGCLVGLTKKGKDNQLTFIGSRSEFISGWGEPNIQHYLKNYGQAAYLAYNYLGESGALYFMRCLPEDATFSNIKINAILGGSDSTAAISITYLDSLNTIPEIKNGLIGNSTTFPLCILYPIGRGEYYNGISVRFTEHSNPMINGVYILDIYEKQNDGSEVVIESFEVSFDPKAVDKSGDSIWITYILESYSSVLRCEMTLGDGDYSPGYNLLTRIYDKDIGSVSVTKTNGNATIIDNKQVFSDWQTSPESGNAAYMIIAKDGKGNKIYGWLGEASGDDFDEINVFNNRNLTSAERNWCGDIVEFDANSDITYEIKKSNTSIASGFISANPVPLKRGSDGSLLNESGDINTAEATKILAEGYAGTLISPITGEAEELITDTENTLFTMVFDAGYPDEVKQQISTLVQTRRDCVAIIDNGDNATFSNSISSRLNTNTFNNYHVAIYEPFNKIYDIFTGQYIWVSPVYHLSYLLPRNDNVAEIWYAAAGFNRAAIDTIQELRFNPKLGQRDQMYLKQLNPIVKFSNGYVVWSQLTSQSKPSAMQDLNIVRLVLYIKKALENACRFFVFEMNDHITWGKVSAMVNEFLDQIRKKRGLYSFSVSVGATEYEKKMKTFHVDVMLQPTRVVERIELNFFIK